MSDSLSPRRIIDELLACVREGERTPAARDEADRRFRERYREWLASRTVPPEAEGHLQAALVALAGVDDWAGARRHLERALSHLPPPA